MQKSKLKKRQDWRTLPGECPTCHGLGQVDVMFSVDDSESVSCPQCRPRSHRLKMEECCIERGIEIEERAAPPPGK